jgi:uncharacterized protein YidB (DUF937 family)
MGILDVIRGMQNGPRGATNPAASGGPSTMTMALLALLAYKAWKASQGSGGATAAPQQMPGGSTADGGGLGGLLGGLLGGQAGGGALGGGLGGGLGGMLGSVLAGGAAGGALGGGGLGGLLGNGLGKLVQDMQANGMGGHAQSWVGTGPNDPIDKGDLAKAIGAEDLDVLVQQTGIPREQFLSALQSQLPAAVDELTPNGRIPTLDELSRQL